MGTHIAIFAFGMVVGIVGTALIYHKNKAKVDAVVDAATK